MSQAPSLEDFRAAAAQDLAMLAMLHYAELDNELLTQLRKVNFPAALGLRLTTEKGHEAITLLTEAIRSLSSPLSSTERDELAADYAAIYLTYTYRASPCESVWLDEGNLSMQAPMFQVREFYRRHQLAAPNWRTRPDDHVVLELQFLAYLMQDAHQDAMVEAARFLDEHLLRWLPFFARRVSHRCATAFYAGVAQLTAAYCDELRDLLAALLGMPRPSMEEIEARMQPRSPPCEIPLAYVSGVAPSW